MQPLDLDRQTGDNHRMSAVRIPHPEPLAPWAEIVPGTGPMTVADLLDWPDDAYRYEVVEGVLVRMAGSKPRALFITMRLLRTLDAYVEGQGLGSVTPPDGVYDFERTGQPNTGLLPDIGFIRAELVPQLDLDVVIPFAPDLAVEIASENQYRPAMSVKARRYLAAGTRLVWIIYPRWRQVDIWRQGHPREAAATLTVEDTLDGEDVVPGFAYPVSNLFPQ